MKEFLKPFKHGLLSLLGSVGYSVQRLPRKPRKTSKVTTLILGGKSIKIHSGNPLCYEYQQHPQLNGHIGWMAALVEKQFPDAWAVDVGANVGDTLAIIKSKASMPVICVEGDPVCYELLQENARQFERVKLIKAFLSDMPGESKVELQKTGWNTTLTEAKGDASGQKLLFQTLDQVVEGLNSHATIKLLKVDAEGYDMRILRGAAKILERDKPVINFELNRENIEPLGDSVGDFFDYLVNLGYIDFILNDPYGELVCKLNQSNKAVLLDLYQFSNIGRPIYYFDGWAFPKSNKDLLDKLLVHERTDARKF